MAWSCLWQHVLTCARCLSDANVSTSIQVDSTARGSTAAWAILPVCECAHTHVRLFWASCLSAELPCPSIPLCSAAGDGGGRRLPDVEKLAAEEPEEHELWQPRLPEDHRRRPQHWYYPARCQRRTHLPCGEFKKRHLGLSAYHLLL